MKNEKKQGKESDTKNGEKLDKYQLFSVVITFKPK